MSAKGVFKLSPTDCKRQWHDMKRRMKGKRPIMIIIRGRRITIIILMLSLLSLVAVVVVVVKVVVVLALLLK